MKKGSIIVMIIVLLLTIVGCGAETTLETWPITYSDSMACYARDFSNIEEMLEEEHIIFHGKAVRLVEERVHGIWLELEVIDSSSPEKENILLVQSKDSRFVLKNGEEAVLILFPTTIEGVWGIPNGNLGAFRIDDETGDMTCPRLDSLLESAPQTYSAKGGKDLTLAQVYDLLVELDNSGE